MRVLITNTASWGTGSGMVAEGVAKQLRELGHDACVVFLDAGHTGAQDDHYYDNPDHYRIIPFPAEFDGVELPSVALMFADPHPRNREHVWSYRDMNEQQFAAYMGYLEQHFRAILADFQPDVIECEHLWAMDHVVNKLGALFIPVAHQSDQIAFTEDPRMQPIAKASAHAAPYIFAISDHVKQEVEELYGVPAEKVVTIPNGYNQDVFHPAAADRKTILAEFDLDIPADMPIITFGGKVSRTKGIDTLLVANAALQKEHPAFLIITGPGDFKDFTAAEQAAFCLDNTAFIGHIPQAKLALLHSTARFSVMPSRKEGFGLGALEAMACGLPVVATRVGGLADFVVGDLISPEDPDALCEAMLKMLKLSDSDHVTMSKRAITAAGQYSWKSVIEKRVHYYEKAVNAG